MHIEGFGGTTSSSLANACYTCTSCYKNSATAQFKVHNMELFEELLESSRDLKVGSLPNEMIGPATRMVVEAGEKLGYFMEPMPKFIDFEKYVTVADSAYWDVQGVPNGMHPIS